MIDILVFSATGIFYYIIDVTKGAPYRQYCKPTERMETRRSRLFLGVQGRGGIVSQASSSPCAEADVTSWILRIN